MTLEHFKGGRGGQAGIENKSPLTATPQLKSLASSRSWNGTFFYSTVQDETGLGEANSRQG